MNKRAGKRTMSPSGQSRSVLIQLRITDEQNEWLKKQAQDDMRYVTDYIRKALIGIGMPR